MDTRSEGEPRCASSLTEWVFLLSKKVKSSVEWFLGWLQGGFRRQARVRKASLCVSGFRPLCAPPYRLGVEMISIFDFLWLGRERWVIYQNLLMRIFVWALGPLGVHARIRNAHVIRIIKTLSLPSKMRIMDAGCGQAYACFWLARHYPNWEIWGIDVDSKVIDHNQKIAFALGMKNLYFREGDITNLGDDLLFDLIFSIDVLEHLENDIEVLSRWRRIIHPVGWLVLHLPLRHQMQKRIFSAFKKHIVRDHVRDEYTEEEIRAKLSQAGFVVLSISYGFSIWGEMAFELNNLFWWKPWLRILLALLTFPVVILMGYIDSRVSWKQGNSLIVLAKPLITIKPDRGN